MLWLSFFINRVFCIPPSEDEQKGLVVDSGTYKKRVYSKLD
uniref:Uncharacterized protein n=1 Tax=Anguilla anguilla TaxID=7936 RepID=A0A0E9XC32_ANGAN